MNEDKNKVPPELFEPITERDNVDKPPSRPAMSFGQEVFLKFKSSRSAMIFFWILVVIVLGAIIIPLFWPFDYAAQNVAFANKPFMSLDPSTGFPHVFGTDHLGRDIFVRIWYGARISLLIAAVVAVIDCAAGVIYGGISGYVGGGVDNAMMRTVEVISGIPYLILVLLLMAVLPQGVGTMILAYSIVGWTGMARLVRGQVMSLREREFILAARAMGAGTGRIISRHLMPNMLGIIVVNITLDIPNVIFTEAFLSMLGMGVPPPYPSLGTMVNEGLSKFQTYPLQLIVPALFICLLMLAFNILGDRLQDALDPKLRRTATYGRRVKNRKPEREL